MREQQPKVRGIIATKSSKLNVSSFHSWRRIVPNGGWQNDLLLQSFVEADLPKILKKKPNDSTAELKDQSSTLKIAVAFFCLHL